MNDQDTGAQPPARPSAKKKQRSSGGLLALLVVLAAVVGLSAFDRSARTKCDEAYGKLNKAIAKGEDVPKDTVSEWLGKAPARTDTTENGDYIEEFDFRGVVFKQTLSVSYTHGEKKLAKKLSKH